MISQLGKTLQSSVIIIIFLLFRTFLVMIFPQNPLLLSTKSLSSSSSQLIPKTLTPSNLIKLGITPSIKSLNLFLSFLLNSQKPNLLLHLISQISSNSIKINSKTCSLVACSLLKTHRFKEGKEIIPHCKRFNFVPQKEIFDSVIQCLCVDVGDPENAFSVLSQCVEDYGIFPSFNSFRSLVLKFSSMGNMGRAIEVLELMRREKDGYPIDNFICSSIISGFCRIGKPELGLGFYAELEIAGGFSPNLVTCTAVVDGLCRVGRVDEACDLVKAMEEKGMALDEVLYSCLIHGHFKSGILMEGFRKHRLMLESGMVPDVVSYTNLIDGFCKEGNAEKVTGFLIAMEKKGMKPNLITYTVLLQGFCMRGKLEEAFCVLKRMEELGLVLDEFVYAILIDGLCRKRDLDRVFSLLEEMERKGIQVGSVTYNTLINGLCKAGEIRKAGEISRGYLGDNFTYSTLLHGYTKEMDRDGVMKTKRRLEEADICMDVVTFNVLIKSLFMIGMSEDAFELFKVMPHKGVVANSVTYRTVIDGLCRSGMAETAIEMFKELAEKNLVSDSVTYRQLIKAQFREGNEEGVLKFIHAIDTLETELLTSVCNHALIFLCENGCFTAALATCIFLRRRRLYITSKSYYFLLKNLIRSENKLITELLLCDCIKVNGPFGPRMTNILSLYLCKKNVEEAMRFLADKNTKDIYVSVLTAAVDALRKEGRSQDALNFLMQAEENGATLDVVVYAIVVDGLCKEGHFEKALDLCSRMREKGIRPNIVIYNSVINGLCQQGCLVEAMRIFDSLELNCVLPTVVTYAILIAALSREGFLEDAERLLKRMVLNGITPNTQIYNSLIHGHCSFGLIKKALKILLELGESGWQPDAFTISSVISGYCQKGEVQDAYGFFNEHKRRGFSPDFLGFLNLIEGLFMKRRMKEARDVLREMLQCAGVMDLIDRVSNGLNVESLISLLNLFCEQARIQEAICVLSEVGSEAFTSWRSKNGCRHKHLKQLEKIVSLDTIGEEGSTNGGNNSLALEIPRHETRHLVADVADTNRGFCEVNEKGTTEGDNEFLTGKSLHDDFDNYHSIIASLCSKGELQKANAVIKTMLLNSSGYVEFVP